MGCVAPTGRNSRSWMKRSSLACTSTSTLQISSRKTVPRLAASKIPRLSLVAPVNEPFTCPNSSDSSSVTVSAPQSTAKKRSCFLGLRLWIARATSSLPVPVSPMISTVLDVVATLRRFRYTSCIVGLEPTMPANIAGSSPGGAGAPWLRSSSCRRSQALRATAAISSGVNGFGR